LLVTVATLTGVLWAGAFISSGQDAALAATGVLATRPGVVTTSVFPETKHAVGGGTYTTTAVVKVQYPDNTGAVLTADLVAWDAQPGVGQVVKVRYLPADRTKVYPADYVPDGSQGVQFAAVAAVIDVACILLFVGKRRKTRPAVPASYGDGLMSEL